MLVWLDASVGVADGVLRAAEAQRFGDIEAWRQGLLAQRDTMLREAREAAQALREQARREAADMAEAALADAQHAVARGYEEGLRRGILEWHARQAEQVVDRSAMLRRMHEKLATIVTSAVERIVHTEQRAALYQRALRSVQGLARGAGPLALRVSTADYEHARVALQSLSELEAQGLAVEVSVDPALSPGSCVFESEAGIIDASLQTQLDGLRGAMERAVRKMVEDTQDAGS